MFEFSPGEWAMMETAADTVLVRLNLGDAVLYLEGRHLDQAAGWDQDEEELDVGSIQPDFHRVTEAIREVSTRISDSLKTSGATRFAVEFGCEIGVETGRLVAVLGKAAASSTLRVTLEWSQPSS
jgi:hypothetical protein